MFAVVFCDLISQDQRSNLATSALCTLSVRCTVELMRARASGDIIFHYFQSWPIPDRTLFGCLARGTEPIYCAQDEFYLKSEHFIEHLLQANVKYLGVIGVLNEEHYKIIENMALIHGIIITPADGALLIYASA